MTSFPLPHGERAADLRRIATMRADHNFGFHPIPFSDCPLCTAGARPEQLDQALAAGRAADHEAGLHRGRAVRACGYCAVYVLRPLPVVVQDATHGPRMLPAPRRLLALPAPRPVAGALPARASLRFVHREAWLAALRDALRPAFEAAEAPIPPSARVTCGFPSSGARGAKKRTIGQCHYTTADRVPDLSVSPVIDDAGEVAATLVHELIHAALPGDGHGARFGRAARKLGLVGKLTETTAGPAALALLAPILAQLGAYPHARIDLATIRRQSTRMLKVICPDPECGYTLRTTAKWLAVGVPTCCCGMQMVAPDVDEDDDGGEALAATREAAR